MSEITEFTKIKKEALKSDDYFTSFVLEAEAEGEIDESYVEKLKLQTIELLAAKCSEFTGGESSSVRTEIGEMIMQSTLFTLGLYLKSLSGISAALEALKTQRVSMMYILGRKIIERKIKISKALFAQAYRSAIATDNYTYNATLIHGGLYSFFKTYNAEFSAHEIPSSIDYQLAVPCQRLLGIEYIEKYLQRLNLENSFCAYFKEEKIERLLNGYAADSSELLINIYEVVLTQCIGCVLADKSPFALELTPSDVEELYKKLSILSRNDAIDAFLIAYKALIRGMRISGKSLLAYTEATLPKLLQQLFYNLKTGTLERFFIIPKENRESVSFVSEGERMDDDAYSVIVERITKCQTFKDKLATIKETVASLADLEDIMFDCEFEEHEIYELLLTLNEGDLAIILRNHPLNASRDLYPTDSAEMTLRNALKKVLDNFTKEKQGRIFKIAEE